MQVTYNIIIEMVVFYVICDNWDNIKRAIISCHGNSINNGNMQYRNMYC